MRDDIPLPDKATLLAALARDTGDRTPADWDEITEAARWALHTVGPLDFDQVTTVSPLAQVSFRAGLLACREYMARFVEQGGDHKTAQSIRANWWPVLGDDDPGAPRIWDWDEVVEELVEHGATVYRMKPMSISQEALPRAWQFLAMRA